LKILIAGGLGYIGSALIELYRKETEHELIILDKLFIPERVASLPQNARYIQGDIGDIKLMKNMVKDIDLLHMMAAEVEAENSIHKEKVVWENNYDAPKNLMELCSNSTRIIFPSTGNVFGGVNEDEKFMGLTEKDKPKPKYPYAETKVAVEKFLLSSNKNFTICRLGTNRGYAPGIRFNLVTNNFIKRAIIGEHITIHGKGENYRPTVSVKDVARGVKMLSTSKKAEGEIFHIIEKNYRIIDLAREVIKFSNEEVELKHIAKDVPFNSYHLNGEKITKLEFKYEWYLEKDVNEMQKEFHALETLGKYKS